MKVGVGSANTLCHTSRFSDCILNMTKYGIYMHSDPLPLVLHCGGTTRDVVCFLVF